MDTSRNKYNENSPYKVNDVDIQALIDNELRRPRARKVIKAINSSPPHFRRYQTLKTQKTLLQRWWYLYHQPQ